MYVYTYIYTHIHVYVCVIMVIVVWNGHGDTSQILLEADSISRSTNTRGKFWIQSFSFFLGILLGRLGFSTRLGEGKLGIQTC